MMLLSILRRRIFILSLAVCGLAEEQFEGFKVLDRALTVDGKYFKFDTRPDIEAPNWEITTNEDLAAPGYWFIAPYEIKTQEIPGDPWVGPHIYDGNGDLVWSGTPYFGHWNVFDFGPEMLGGELHLSGLEWHEQRGVVVDSSYNIVRTAPSVAANDTFQNMHGFHLVDDGKHALVQTVHGWHTPNEVTRESLGLDMPCNANYEGFREVDLSPGSYGKVLFEWNGRKIHLNESTYRNNDAENMCRNGWDLLHVNAVDKCPDGDYLLSARHTDALYKISHINGSIVWRLGGSQSDFVLRDDVKFSRQHHCRCQSQNDTHTIVTLFDNAVGEHWQSPTRLKSRGLILSLDMASMEANVVRQYENPSGFLTDGRGSFQTLANGNVFVNWATASHISEHTYDGELVLEASLTAKVDTYRAFKSPWIGRPTTSPDVHSEIFWRNDHPYTVVAMSWNGATEHATWDVHGLDEQGDDFCFAKNVSRTGFETKIEYDGFATNVYAQAYSADGELLGASSSGAGDLVPGAQKTILATQSTQPNGFKTLMAVLAVLLTVAGFACGFLAAMGRGRFSWPRKGAYSGSESKERGHYQMVDQDSQEDSLENGA